MLKPTKKITKKEIKRDPLLETTYKVKTYLDDNQANIIKAAVAVAAVIIIAIVLIGRSQKAADDAQTSFGKALVAYAQQDFTNAILQFESVADNFSGDDNGVMANYYLGKIYYDQGNFADAMSVLEKFVKTSSVDLLLTNAYAMIGAIQLGNGDKNAALKSLKNAVDTASDANTKAEQELNLASLLIDLGNQKDADMIIERLLNDESISGTIKNKVEELSGKLIVMKDRL